MVCESVTVHSESVTTHDLTIPAQKFAYKYMATPNIQGTFGSFISSAVTLPHSELHQHLQGTSRRNQTCLTYVQRFGSTLKFRLLVLSHLKLKVCCNQSVTALICNQIVNKDIQSGRRLSLKPNHYKIAVVYYFFTIICL